MIKSWFSMDEKHKMVIEYMTSFIMVKEISQKYGIAPSTFRKYKRQVIEADRNEYPLPSHKKCMRLKFRSIDQNLENCQKKYKMLKSYMKMDCEH